jgi:hypothetical protein
MAVAANLAIRCVGIHAVRPTASGDTRRRPERVGRALARGSISACCAFGTCGAPNPAAGLLRPATIYKRRLAARNGNLRRAGDAERWQRTSNGTIEPNESSEYAASGREPRWFSPAHHYALTNLARPLSSSRRHLLERRH